MHVLHHVRIAREGGRPRRRGGDRTAPLPPLQALARNHRAVVLRHRRYAGRGRRPIAHTDPFVRDWIAAESGVVPDEGEFGTRGDPIGCGRRGDPRRRA